MVFPTAEQHAFPVFYNITGTQFIEATAGRLTEVRDLEVPMGL